VFVDELPKLSPCGFDGIDVDIDAKVFVLSGESILLLVDAKVNIIIIQKMFIGAECVGDDDVTFSDTLADWRYERPQAPPPRGLEPQLLGPTHAESQYPFSLLLQQDVFGVLWDGWESPSLLHFVYFHDGQSVVRGIEGGAVGARTWRQLLPASPKYHVRYSHTVCSHPVWPRAVT